MVNANRKGRGAENRVATFLEVHGYEAELVRLAGMVDRGDIWVPHGARDGINQRLEVKNHANVLNALNEAMHDVVKLNALFPHEECWGIVARPGKSTGEWYAVKQVKDVWPPK